MNNLTEDKIEQLSINFLKELGYSYIHGPDIAHDGNSPERSSYEEIILTSRLRQTLARINPTIPADSREEAIKEMQRISSPEVIANNESFHRILTEGIKVSYQKEGHQRGDLVWLVDFNNPENNEFLVINQYTIVENAHNKRPDIILFVNGIPLVVMELKNPTNESATLKSAYQQLDTYKKNHSRPFHL